MDQVSDQEWAEFKEKFGKIYKDAEEEEMRRGLYTKVKARVEEHNKKFANGEVTFSMAINHLSDLTEEEFALRRGGRKPPTD